MTSGTRLVWRSRRGIREMDILFQRFLELRYDGLSGTDKAAFDKLLDEDDPDIMNWIMEKETPPQEFLNVIKLIRELGSLQ